jgi:hypothetical protein
MSGKIWWLALLCGALLALPAAAQEGADKEETPSQAPTEAEKNEAPPAPPAVSKDAKLEDQPMHRWGAWTISLAAWSPSMVGGEDEIAIVVPTNNHAPYPLMLGAEANIRESWLVAYHLPRNLGSVVMHYDSMNYNQQATYLSPGQFIYGESQAYPGYRGAFDDGFADGVSAEATRKTREVRFEFSDTAWQTKHTRATWGAGVHNIDYAQQLRIEYYALVPNLPPVIPPVIDPAPDPATYAPRPDYVTQQSDYSGSGVGGSLDVEFVLHPRFSIISGLSIGLLRGKVTTSYQSLTSYYYSTDGGYHYLSKDELFDILNNGTENQIKQVGQDSVTVALSAPNVSQAAQTFDLYVGVQSAVWRGLKVFATYREMYYQNVGARAVPTTALTIDRQTLSVGYEGYLVGLSWRF